MIKSKWDRSISGIAHSLGSNTYRATEGRDEHASQSGRLSSNLRSRLSHTNWIGIRCTLALTLHGGRCIGRSLDTRAAASFTTILHFVPNLFPFFPPRERAIASEATFCLQISFRAIFHDAVTLPKYLSIVVEPQRLHERNRFSKAILQARGLPPHYTTTLSKSLPANATRIPGVVSGVRRAKEMFYVGYC